MNTTVTAQNMKIQAKVESGLLISADKTDASWAAADETAYTTAVALAPTSTSDGSTWYHNTSKVANTATGAEVVGTYKTLGTTEGTNVIVVKDKNLATGDAVAQVTYADEDNSNAYEAAKDTAYYLMNTFYLKSSGEEIEVDGSNKYLQLETITLTGASTSKALDASVRIGVKIGSKFTILAPFAAATASYNVNGSVAIAPKRGLIDDEKTSYEANVDTAWTGNIPAKTEETPLSVDIYLWFEGEDANCKSNNVQATLDELVVSVELGLTDVTPTGTAGIAS